MRFVYHLLGAFAFAGLVSCSDDLINDFHELQALKDTPVITPEDSTDNEIEPVSPMPINGKKGIGIHYSIDTWNTRLTASASHWYYSWTPRRDASIPENVQFVPMFWGKEMTNTENVNYVRGLAEEGKVAYLMGFNEPDNAEQANMTVQRALDLWPLLEQVGVPLVSPCTVHFDNDWMKEFMYRAEQLNYRIDYFAMHWYADIDPKFFINDVKRAYEMYKKPIWITEFAVGDWDATNINNNKYSSSDILEFMEAVLPALDTMPYVERYAWFNSDPEDPNLGRSVLYDENEGLTILGEFYATHEPNAFITQGRYIAETPLIDPRPNLLENGSFEINGITHWSSTGVSLVDIAEDGIFAVKMESKESRLEHVVKLTPFTSYDLAFASKFEDIPDQNFSMIILNETQGKQILEIPLPQNTDWTKSSVRFYVKGDATIRLIIAHPYAQQALLLDDFSLVASN
ncbi:glycosyl hydrolase [Robertkochia solimangrovi]|uniref:glycosyl hydrolase n=1 Tax=Robertkochia solimangrovi TaxID=2213046 RepID=UPI00117DEF1A|nr:glycosyl hydrolase [Robertkochia solimangrovi]TRZ42850.1 hypothetical protein DMZ48_12330 [Robertkochia solimangrovi]